ncbi:MAG: UxaA family hydrolase, partial [Rubrivivax sp.]|nr:UxaA family hydrolase [Rubrivivax sp.]
MKGFKRSDGRKGIRNYTLVVYLVECAHHVAREIAAPFPRQEVQVLGFSGCYPNEYAFRVIQSFCTHPNVGAVLLVSLGCEGFDRIRLQAAIAASSRPVQILTIQEVGGTRKTVEQGREWLSRVRVERPVEVPLAISDLIIGTKCGGSDGTSVITANPAIGCAVDRLVAAGATCIFEETGELIGCEEHMAQRAVAPVLAHQIRACIPKAAAYYRTLGYGSIAVGNAEGGLTTQEEKSLGAYTKSGRAPILGLLKPGDHPPQPGLYLMDMISDGEVRFGIPNINDNVDIGDMIACGAHLILFSTGRGSVVGSAVAPVIKVCANPETYRRMEEDMDIN